MESEHILHIHCENCAKKVTHVIHNLRLNQSRFLCSLCYDFMTKSPYLKQDQHFTILRCKLVEDMNYLCVQCGDPIETWIQNFQLCKKCCNSTLKFLNLDFIKPSF